MAVHLSERELEIVKETVAQVMKEHPCFLSDHQQKVALEVLDEEKDRVEHLIQIADAARLVGIESDGHIVLFSVGKQVTIIGQKAIGKLLIGFLILSLFGLFFLFGGGKWLATLFVAKGV